MDTKNIFEKNTCKVQQIAVISKIHNMQWLKSNPPQSGHIKPKTDKGIVKVLKDGLQTSDLKTGSKISVPNVSTTDNLPFINTTTIVSTMNSNKYNCDIESNVDENSVVTKSKETSWQVNNNMTDLDQQLLILQELEHDEMISMAIQNSLFSLEMESQLKLEEEQKGEEPDTAECDLTLSKIKDCTSEVNQKDIHDNNNNNNLNIISQPDLNINDTRSDILLSKVGADKKDQSINIDSNTETNISLNLTNSKEISVSNNDEITPISSTTSKNNIETKDKSKCEVKQLLKKKDEPKVIVKNAAPISTSNKRNSVILGQTIESKTKYGIKQPIKDLSTEVLRKIPDKRNQEPNQSMLNTSKVLKSKYNLQPKKEVAIVKHSPGLSTRYAANAKESEQNKTTLNTPSKEYGVNRVRYTFKKDESGSMSKVYNHSSKTMQHFVKGVPNPNSPNLTQPTSKQSSNTSGMLSNHKTILKTSDAPNKYKDIQQKTILKNDEVTETFTIKEECDNRYNDTNKVFVDIIDKDKNSSLNEVKRSSENSIENLTNEHSINECIKSKEININPFLGDVSNLINSNKIQIDTKNVKDITDNNLSINNTQLDNISSANITYVHHVPQQNVQQEQTPPSFIRYIPDQFTMDCSVNTTLPKFHSNALYPNTNTINQYGNIQTISNVPLGAQIQNCSSSNVAPLTTGNMNTLQYQMPNVLSCNGQNVIRPPPNFCVHPMSQEEQFNLPAYGLNPAYFMNPVCVCRNDCFPSHPQNWDVPHNYPVLLQQNPYHVNYTSFCNQPVQLNNMNHKKTNTARPFQSLPQAQILREQNLQRNYGKPVSNSGYNIRNPQNYNTYDTKQQVQNSTLNTRETIDVKIEKPDGEFLSDKESNNLPMISPKACMIYGNALPTNVNTIRPQMQYSGNTDSVSNCHVQYQKNNEYYNISKTPLPTDACAGRGKNRFTHPNQQSYKAQY